MADADGRNPVRVADGAPSKEGFCGGYWGEATIWSPDGRYLAYRGDGGKANRARVTGPSTSATRAATASRRSLVTGGPSRGRPTPPGSLCGRTSTGRQSSRSTDSTECARRCSPCRPDGLLQATSTRCGHPMAPRSWFPVARRSPSTGPRRVNCLWTTRDRIVSQVLAQRSRDRLHLPGRARRRCGRWFSGSRAGRRSSAGFRGLAFTPRVVAHG